MSVTIRRTGILFTMSNRAFFNLDRSKNRQKSLLSALGRGVRKTMPKRSVLNFETASLVQVQS